MRLLVYNIRYGTGGKRLWFPWSGYLRVTSDNLRNIIRFIASLDPDIAGLIEVDDGSYRSERTSQAQSIAHALGHFHTYRSKYSVTSFANHLPILNKQGNAFLTKDSIHNEKFHYFDKGMKRLVIELELSNLTVYLVHLALSYRVRHQQLERLHSLIKGNTKPHIVAGDFNALSGSREMNLFMAATNLINANAGEQASFPSWAPKRQLDFVLHSPGIQPRKFWLPRVTYSDHLPLVLDFDVE